MKKNKERASKCYLKTENGGVVQADHNTGEVKIVTVYQNIQNYRDEELEYLFTLRYCPLCGTKMHRPHRPLILGTSRPTPF